MNKRLSLTTYFYISAFLIFSGLFSFQVHATGIASVNSYVEIKTSASDFRARKQSSSGQNLPRDMTLLLLLREQIFVSKARAALSAPVDTTLLALAMCQMEVPLRLYLATHQLILT